jgi:hypothetical protein
VAPPRALAAAALERVADARTLLGPVTLDALDDVPPCWRGVLTAVAEHTEVVWRRLDEGRPAWLPPAARCEHIGSIPGHRVRVACATPAHEALEALRWARALVADGRAAPHEIALAAASPAPYDASLLAAARAADLPLHAVHGVPLLETAVGGVVAALADVVVRGLSAARVRRLVATLAPSDADAAALDDAWWSQVPAGLPLERPERWRAAVPEGDAGAWLLALVTEIAAGPAGAATLGERRLQGEALAAWRRALDDGPAEALDATVARLRTGDGVDPLGAIVWGPAGTLSRSPRPFTRLLGLAARSWPRRPQDDPLVPEHVLGGAWPGPSLAQLDRAAFERFARHVGRELVVSRARRDDDGRELVASPLVAAGPFAALDETTVTPRRASPRPLDEAERLAARPAEAAASPRLAAATRAHRAWRSDGLTPFDGVVRPDHPALRRGLERLHSATSLRRLLRDPLGFVWSFVLGVEALDDESDPFRLTPRHLGTFAHTVLERALEELEATVPGGAALAGDEAIAAAVATVLPQAARELEATAPVPPGLAWRQVQEQVRALAVAALGHPLTPLPGQRSFAEVRFGDPRAAQRPGQPWDPTVPVAFGAAGLRIRGVVDRLDLAGDRRMARVVDYKTGSLRVPQAQRGGLQGGREVQRALYAVAVRQILGEEVEVEALLLYPRSRETMALAEPDAALATLTSALDAAVGHLLAGRCLPGPDAFGEYNDLAFALPADARRGYGSRTAGHVREALPELAALWGEA